MPRVTNALLLKTSAGSAFVNPDAQVTVKVSEGRFVKKRAKDLNEGDMVLVYKEFVSLPNSLEEVDRILYDGLPRYKSTFGKLFEFNSRQKRVPRLRCELLRGLAQAGLVSRDEPRILKETPDYSAAEFSLMVASLQQTLAEASAAFGTPERSETALREWLQGDVIAPSDFRLFSALKGLNPELARMGEEGGEFAGSYSTYVSIRRGVMHEISAIRACGTGKGREREGNSHGREGIKDALSAVRSHFVADVDEQMVAASVFKIREVEQPAKKQDGAGASGASFSKGIVSEGVKCIDMREVYDAYSTANELMLKLIEKYYRVDFFTADLILTCLSSQMKLGSPEDDVMEFYKTLPKDAQAVLQKMASLVFSEIENGSMDAFFRLEAPQAQNLLNIYERASRALPRLFFTSFNTYAEWVYAEYGEMKLGNSEKRKLGKKVDKQEKALLSLYNIDKNNSKKLALASYRATRRILMVADHVLVENPYEYKKGCEKRGIAFFKRDEIFEIANKYGVEGFMFLLEKNFLSENPLALGEFEERISRNDKEARMLLSPHELDRASAAIALAAQGDAAAHLACAYAFNASPEARKAAFDVVRRTASPKCLEMLVIKTREPKEHADLDMVFDSFKAIAGSEKNHPLVRELAGALQKHTQILMNFRNSIPASQANSAREKTAPAKLAR